MVAMGDQLAQFGGSTAVLTRAGGSPSCDPQAYDDDAGHSLTGHLRVIPGTVSTDAAGPDDAGTDDAGPQAPATVATHVAEPLAPATVPGPDAPLSLTEINRLLVAAAAAAPAMLAAADYVEAANFAGTVEEASRSMEYLQVLAAGTVDRTRNQAIAAADAARAGRSRTGKGWVTGWDNGVETLNETDAAWPEGPAGKGSATDR
ncbi:HNH endonuclease, partial [Pseudarthrobacter sp. NPDC058329]